MPFGENKIKPVASARYEEEKLRQRTGCGGPCLQSQHWGGKGRQISASVRWTWPTHSEFEARQGYTVRTIFKTENKRRENHFKRKLS